MAKRSGTGSNSPAKAKTPKPSRVGRAQLTSWQTPETIRQLRILAAEEDTTIQALMTEAVNLLFEKYGKNPVATNPGNTPRR